MADTADPPLTPLTVASLIADAQAALLPPPTVETLLHRLVFPYRTIPCYRGGNGLHHSDFVDAFHPAAKPSSTFSGLFSLPSLGSILSRTGAEVLSSLVGDAKNRVLYDLTSDERAALDKALESFFSPQPRYTSSYSQILPFVKAFWDVCKAVAPDLPDRTWATDPHAYEFDHPLHPLLYNTQSIFAALKSLTANEGPAGVHVYNDLGRSDRTVLEELEKQLVTSMGGAKNEVVLLLDNARFRPIFILGLDDSNPSLRKLIDDLGADGGPRASLESVGAVDPETVSRLTLVGHRLKTRVVKKNYVLVFGAEVRLDASLESEQQSLLHMLALAALADNDNLRKEIETELLRHLASTCELHGEASPSVSPSTSPSTSSSQSTPLKCAGRPALPLENDSPESGTSTVDEPPTFKAFLSKLKAQRATSPSRYRLVTFDELEKGCAFTAAFVGYHGQLVGYLHFPSSAPLEKPSSAKVPSLPPTPPPTPPPCSSHMDDALGVPPAEPILLLSGRRLGSGHQGYVYRTHCAGSPFPFLAKYSHDWEGFTLMEDEAKFYRQNREVLEEEQLAPRFVGSWKTEGNGSPRRNGSATMLLLVEEWGQALTSFRDLKGCEAQRHMKELAMRFHLSLQHKHESLSSRNVVWRPDEGSTSLRLIDFASSEPHKCTGKSVCSELEFAAKRRTRQAVKEELLRVATVQQELERQATREAALWWTVTAGVGEGERLETGPCEVELGQKRKASPGREGGDGNEGFESPPATPRQRPAKRMA
uniref:Proteophosphoglycan ppg4 n=1 Tax=Rhodotorula toruloides TaxID=5286 RepID=A0A0K3CN80_RHOTO